MDTSKLDGLIEAAIKDGAFPGACYAVHHKGRNIQKNHGRFTYCPESPETRLDTIWDLASVSKVVGTTTGAMILEEQGKLNLDQPVAEMIPAFGGNGKDKVTVRNLLVHDSGLIAFRPYHRTLKKPEDVIAAVYAEKLDYPTGTKTIYSDLSIITLGKVIETLSGQTLDGFLKQAVFDPLGMTTTMYRPSIRFRSRCAPTEWVEPWRAELRALAEDRPQDVEQERKEHELRTKPDPKTIHPDAEYWIQGEVHDPTATVLGGVAGHAGLFSILDDLCRFMKMMLNEEGAKRIVCADTVNRWTKRQSEKSSRALGWDTPSKGSSAGTKLTPRSFGHTGYTGTSVWCDPEKDLFVILLTNRVHPTASNTKLIQFRPVFHDAVVDSL